MGGKGGVGKTTCAAAIALRRARRGRTLLVSTDPAASLSHAARVAPRARHLDVRRVDAHAAFRTWLAPRKDVLAAIALRGTYLDAEDVNRLLNLSLPGIDEVAALLEIIQVAEAGYEHVVIDTAPTGHTLRLLEMPSLYQRLADVLDMLQSHHRGVVSALTGRYAQDAADRFIAGLAEDAAGLIARLRDDRSEFVWVTLPEPMALEETADAISALSTAGISVRTLIVNRTAPEGGCEWDDARRRFERRALAPLAARFANVHLRRIPELADEPRDVAALQTLAAACEPVRSFGRPAPAPRRVYGELGVRARVSEVPSSLFGARWLLFGGKGGVGKSTCGAAAALELARESPDDRFLLVSMDPAHSLADVLGATLSDAAGPIPGAPANLDVREIDAGAGLRRFRERYLGAIDGIVDACARAGGAADWNVFRELIDLAPPGLDEVMAITDVAELLVEGGPYRTIVGDTAPTGHALRLLETPAVLREWTRALMAILLKYREVVRAEQFAEMLVTLSRRLRSLEHILRDPSQTAFVLVTRPAPLPRMETMALHQSLRELGIPVGAVIVNAAGAGSCRRCRDQVQRQRREIEALASGLGRTAPYAMIVAPSALPPPHGAHALQAWRKRWRTLET